MEIISTILGIVISVTTIGGVIIKFISKTIKQEVEPIKKSLTEVQIADAKNYLVSFLAAVERGDPLTIEEIQRGYEVYEKYTEELHQNHYVKDKWNRLKPQLDQLATRKGLKV